MRNAIYYFFEKVDENADGSAEEGARYYKCYLGNRKIFKIGRKMNYNTNGASDFTIECSPSLMHLRAPITFAVTLPCALSPF